MPERTTRPRTVRQEARPPRGRRPVLARLPRELPELDCLRAGGRLLPQPALRLYPSRPRRRPPTLQPLEEGHSNSPRRPSLRPVTTRPRRLPASNAPEPVWADAVRPPRPWSTKVPGGSRGLVPVPTQPATLAKRPPRPQSLQLPRRQDPRLYPSALVL